MVRLARLFIGLIVVPAAFADPGLTSQPLAPRSGPRGATLFKELSGPAIGITTENHYADPKIWWDRYQQFMGGPIGTGVAIGDYDGDGRPDIFVVSKTETCRLFRNLGSWKFEDVTEKAGVLDHGAAASEWKQGATFVDLNNDGRLDIYLCRFAASNLLYINQGNGTFKEEASARGLAVNDACGMAAFCDYDRDGWLDLYLQTNELDSERHPNGQPDYLFHNNGNGTFTDVTGRAGISGETHGHSATWWDYDHDGWPDLYVANDFVKPDTLYHNNRDGTFTNTLDRVVPHTPSSSMGADLGDVNNDGLIDLFVADMAATSVEKDLRGMAGERARQSEDSNNAAAAPQYVRNALYLNTEAGLCLEAANLMGLGATDWTWSVRFEDLDNDGWLDLHVTNGMAREQTNTDLLQRSMAAESPGARIKILKASPVLAEQHLAYRNLKDLQFAEVSQAWGLDQKGVGFGAAFGDLDGDGDLDLVYSSFQHGLTILRNDSGTGHRLMIALRGTISNRFGVGATVQIETASGRQVRQLVLARGYLSTSEPTLHFGLGDETKIRHLTVTWPSGQVQTFADLSVDCRLTITEPSTPPPRLAIATTVAKSAQFSEVSDQTGLALFARGAVFDETREQKLLPFRFNRRGPALAVGDLDGDSRDDLVMGGTTKDPTRVLLADASGRFPHEATRTLPTGEVLNDGPVLLFDANGDGKNDVLVTKGGVTLPAGEPDYQPTLYLNDGSGGYVPAPPGTLPSFFESVGVAAAADFNREGHLGLFIGGRVLPGRYPLSPHSALWANRGGKFEDMTKKLAPALAQIGLVTSALWSDVDGDGWIDLLIILEWGSVKYFHNQAGQGFDDWSERAGFTAAGTGWWTSIASADFNGDGRPDYVVGNAGLNTIYHASPAEPALLFYGEFKEDAPPQIIEARYDGARIAPWRSRRELVPVLAQLLKRFPKNDDFARAPLADIVGADRLASAQRFAATELRSGVFLSNSEGIYRFEALPRIAQISPIQGVVAGDFDGDGYADIYAVQNSSAPVSSIGRFDGGVSQLLRGDGRGHFTAVPLAESGLIVPGDAKALAVVDLNQDSWPDFVVSRNNAAMLAYRNSGYAGRQMLAVHLRGPVGNLTSIGARVTVEFSNGFRQVAEIFAGGGFASQSSASCFFGFTTENPPRSAIVRWPSGNVTTHSLQPDATEITLTTGGSS